MGSVAAAFQQICQAAILHWWSPNRQRALYTNSLLNYGNQLFEAYAPAQSGAAGKGTQSASGDAFWLAPPPVNNMLAFSYPASALPDGFEVGVQRPTRHRAEGHKRQQPDSYTLSYQQLKKAKAASGRPSKRQHGDMTGGKARTQVPELSPKLQKRLATLLELVTADTDVSGIKQV